MMGLRSHKPGLVGVGSALLASLCCVTPVVLALAGIGGAGTAMALMKVQWPAVVLSMAVLGFSYVAYFKRKRQCAVEGCSMTGRGVNLLLLGFSTTVISVLFLGLVFPSITFELLRLLTR